jgi:arginyl-tRNA synthetase
MMDTYKQQIDAVCRELFDQQADVELSRTDEQHGDFATNVAMQLAGKLGKNPREIADQIVQKLIEQNIEAAVAGPGFINVRMQSSDAFSAALSATQLPQRFQDQTIVTEYSDPNPFKVLHAGHLYTTLVGDAISNILAAGGATVQRVNFGGDVGLHVAKAMWGILHELGGEHPEKLDTIPGSERATWISSCYVKGNTTYIESEVAKEEIIDNNKRIYDLHSGNDRETDFAKIYWTCREWSYDGFEALYQKLHVQLVCRPMRPKIWACLKQNGRIIILIAASSLPPVTYWNI